MIHVCYCLTEAHTSLPNLDSNHSTSYPMVGEAELDSRAQSYDFSSGALSSLDDSPNSYNVSNTLYASHNSSSHNSFSHNNSFMHN